MKQRTWFLLSLALTITLLTGYSRADETIWMDASPSKPVFHSPPMVKVPENKLFFWTVPVSGQRPMTYLATNLPSGFSINKRTGTITGTIAKEGSYVIEVTATNKAGRATRTIRFVSGPRGLAAVPPMGWNSYDCFGDNVTEAEVLANAKCMAEKMLPFGWDTVVVDYCWYDPGAHNNDRKARAGAELTMDSFGRLLPATNRFPSAAGGAGFQPLASQIHAMGLKFGIHIMRGIPRNALRDNLPIADSKFKACDAVNTNSVCEWCPDMFAVYGNTPAGQAYYQSLIDLYASWGVDYIKMDDTSFPYATDEINAIHKALNEHRRPIILSLSPGETPIQQGTHVSASANLWRISADFWDEWKPLTNQFALGAKWLEFAGPGHWPDADMLPLGHLSVGGRSVGPDRQTRFTKSEQVTMMTLWSMLPSPMMVGANLPDLDPWTLALLTNPEVLEINQDVMSLPGTRVMKKGQVEVWTKKLVQNRALAVAFFNMDDVEQTVSVDWSTLKIKGPHTVRDLWLRKNLSRFNDKFSAMVPPHGAVLLRFSPR